MMTLNEFLQQALHKQQLPDADFIYLLEDIADACKQVAKAVSHGALTGNMGSLETENLHGDTQKQLDVIANDIFLQVNEANGHFAGMASEEMDDPYEILEQYRKHGKYLLLFDPLDGSSNVNLNFTVGSIFSILRQPVAGTSPVLADYLQPGTQQLCAGYALYGSSTMLVFATGHGVNGFTLDTDTGHFVLTHADMRIPAESSEFAINMSRQKLWQPPVQRYVEECLQGKSGPRGKAFNMRWVASMVAEVHRILIRGGVFMYPLDSELQGKGGRLRLMYEANPMSFIVEQAGGMASTGYQRILESQPKDLHQRTPVILGSTDEVELLIRYHCSD